MPKLDTQDPHLADIFRRAKLERENQDKRIADIFGKQKVPKVTEETLAIYLAYLKQYLEMPCHLTGIEDLGWAHIPVAVCLRSFGRELAAIVQVG